MDARRPKFPVPLDPERLGFGGSIAWKAALARPRPPVIENSMDEDTEIEFPNDYEMCCGKQKCPSVKLEKDGVLLHAPTPELEWLGDFETGTRAGLRLTPEQASELRRWLQKKGF